MTVGQEIRRIREDKGWSQAKLGVLSGTGPSGISQIETGRRNPSAGTLQRIADALEVEVRDLFPLGQVPLPDLVDERRPIIDYGACRTALEGFCDHWQPALSGKRRLDRQGFEDFKADAASLAGMARVAMGVEMAERGQQYDEEGDPVFYTEWSEFGPAIVRFDDIAIRMDRIGKERFGEDTTDEITTDEITGLSEFARRKAG